MVKAATLIPIMLQKCRILKNCFCLCKYLRYRHNVSCLPPTVLPRPAPFRSICLWQNNKCNFNCSSSSIEIANIQIILVNRPSYFWSKNYVISNLKCILICILKINYTGVYILRNGVVHSVFSLSLGIHIVIVLIENLLFYTHMAFIIKHLLTTCVSFFCEVVVIWYLN